MNIHIQHWVMALREHRSRRAVENWPNTTSCLGGDWLRWWFVLWLLICTACHGGPYTYGPPLPQGLLSSVFQSFWDVLFLERTASLTALSSQSGGQFWTRCPFEQANWLEENIKELLWRRRMVTSSLSEISTDQLGNRVGVRVRPYQTAPPPHAPSF